LHGLDTLRADSGIASMLCPEAGVEGGTACAWRRLAGRPATQEGAAERGGFLLPPMEHLWQRGLEGTGQAGGEPHCVTDPTTPVLAELCEGAPGGALRPERLQLVAMGEQQGKVEGSVRGGVFGPAGRAGVAIPRQPQGMDGAEAQQGLRAQGRDQRVFGARKTKGHGWTPAPRASRGAPRVNGLGGVRKLEGCPFYGVRRLEADIMVGLRPVKTNPGSKGFGCCLGQAFSPRGCESARRDRGADVLRRHEREPGARQSLRRR